MDPDTRGRRKNPRTVRWGAPHPLHSLALRPRRPPDSPTGLSGESGGAKRGQTARGGGAGGGGARGERRGRGGHEGSLAPAGRAGIEPRRPLRSPALRPASAGYLAACSKAALMVMSTSSPISGTYLVTPKSDRRMRPCPSKPAV